MTVPDLYREPFGCYTDAAIAAYRAYGRDPIFNPPPTLAQVRLLGEYCQDFINEYTYPVDELKELRRRIATVKTLTDLADWLWDCRRIGIEPL
jgi:hypothetical protein